MSASTDEFETLIKALEEKDIFQTDTIGTYKCGYDINISEELPYGSAVNLGFCHSAYMITF
jgi:hypothetical protein